MTGFLRPRSTGCKKSRPEDETRQVLECPDGVTRSAKAIAQDLKGVWQSGQREAQPKVGGKGLEAGSNQSEG